ncbi:MAG: response regulator transcription factor [Clostridia bacterium]|nr:response regulator transcription factor [Clostridia bacterium]
MLFLLAEDDPKIAHFLIELMKKDGYQVDHALDGAEVLDYVKMNDYDIIIMDWMMPNLNGIDAVKILRKNGFEGGILMLTAKDDLENKVIGFEAGVDDYLVKPFQYKELKLRLLALLRRTKRGIVNSEITIGNLNIDLNHKSVHFQKEVVHLSKREYQLLLVLAENANQIVPREKLIDLVWGMDTEVTMNNLDAHIRLLRKKIGGKKDSPIINVRGIGYKMEG